MIKVRKVSNNPKVIISFSKRNVSLGVNTDLINLFFTNTI
jgi:hypothetical protein